MTSALLAVAVHSVSRSQARRRRRKRLKEARRLTTGVDVTPLATGAELQFAAASVLAPTARRGTFSFGGQELAPDQPLADLGVCSESIVDFTPRLWNTQELEEYKPIFQAEFVVGDHSQSVFLQFRRYGPISDLDESVHHFDVMERDTPGHVVAPGFHKIAVSEFRRKRCPAGIDFMPTFDLSKRDDGTPVSPSYHERFPFDVAFRPASCLDRFYDAANLEYTVTFNAVVYVEGK